MVCVWFVRGLCVFVRMFVALYAGPVEPQYGSVLHNPQVYHGMHVFCLVETMEGTNTHTTHTGMTPGHRFGRADRARRAGRTACRTSLTNLFLSDAIGQYFSKRFRTRADSFSKRCPRQGCRKPHCWPPPGGVWGGMWGRAWCDHTCLMTPHLPHN